MTTPKKPHPRQPVVPISEAFTTAAGERVRYYRAEDGSYWRCTEGEQLASWSSVTSAEVGTLVHRAFEAAWNAGKEDPK